MHEYNYIRIVDIKKINNKNDSLEISTVFMNDMFSKIKKSEYTLFMSATIDEYYVKTTLNIPDEELGFINAGGIFDPENKSIIFCNIDYFNYEKMNDTKYLNTICEAINMIIEEHQNEKGIILTTSFKLSRTIYDSLSVFLKENDIDFKIFIQSEKESLSDILKIFKEYTDNGVLISPSIFEGIDLPDETSRFQIFSKAPYYSLGDKRIKYILDNHNQIYKKLAIYRMIQGCGRSCRNEDDYCVNYFLDMNLNKLFNDNDNIWKKEFSISEW
jgi:Rad3-related DNA helicase